MSFSNKKKKTQEGYALILAIFVAAFFITMTAITSQYTLETLRTTRSGFQKIAQAKNVAEAGLQDAVFWFENQTAFSPAIVVASGIWCDGGTGSSCVNGVTKSVNSLIPASLANHLAFRPVAATSSISRGDTDDSRGIIRDIVIDQQNNLYGHYEVLRYDPDKWSETNDQNLNVAVMDISDEKVTTLKANSTATLGYENSQAGKARYWRIISTGTLYRRKSGQAPNQMLKNSIGNFDVPYTGCEIIGKYTLSENLLKIQYDDQKAPIYITDASKFTSFSNSLITADSANGNIAVKAGTGTLLPVFTSAASRLAAGISGDVSVAAGFSFDTNSVFGLSSQEMKGIATQKGTSLNQLKRDPATGRFGSSEIIYLEGSSATTFTFDSNSPLKGGGILYVKDANLNLANMGSTVFSGVIYMKGGNLTIGGLNSISGSIYVENGTLAINGSGEKADIGYNKRVIDNIMKSISRYREDSLSYKTISVK